jgi:4-alpha-glucanotransferase
MPATQRFLAEGAPPLDAVLRALLQSRSRLTIIPVQDLFGWRDRINTPAQVSDGNWTWRLPWPVDRLRDIADARARAEALAAWTRDANRAPSP